MDCIQINGVEVYYQSIGTGRPILFLHGNPADHRSMMSAFEPVFEHQTGWQRIYIDLLGLGQTKGPDWIDSNDQVLDIILFFLDSVIQDQHFLVIGESYGGYLARGIAYHRSEYIDGMFLLSPVVKVDFTQRQLPERIVLFSDEEYVKSLPAELREALGNVAVVHSREVGDRLLKDYISAMRISDQVFLRRIRQKYAFSFNTDLLTKTHEFPSLIILGKQDGIVGYKDQIELLSSFPRGTLAVLDRAGHVSELEQPTLFNALVSEWLDRVDEFLQQDSEQVQ